MTTTTYAPAARWADAITDYERAQRAAGHSLELIMKRCAHLARFSHDTDVSPWDVTFDQFAGWLEALPVSDATRRNYRSSLRSAYRFWTKEGRLRDDPTLEPSRRATALPIPVLWEARLREFRSFLRVSGSPETTVESRLGHMTRFARGHASIAPEAVTFDDLIVWLAGHEWQREYRRGVLGSIHRFFGWMLDADLISVDPSARMPVVKAGQPKPRPVQDEEYRLAVERATPREYIALRLAAELGLRRAEVVALHSRDLIGPVDRCTIVVTGKGNKQRIIPIPAPLAALIREHAEGFVFPGAIHGHMSPRRMGKLVSALLPAGVTMHGLRHRFATRAYNVDRDVFTVQKLLGHSSPATTQRYVQVTDDGMRRLVEAVAS